MIRLLCAAATAACLLTLPYPAEAQFRGRSESRDDDSDRDRGDSDRSRGESSRGGFDWRGRSEEGSRGESDRGRSGWSRGEGGDSERRGFGPPGGFGGPGFGPPGGGGPPGGFGGPGGFTPPSPESMFDRLDRDGDGRLGSEEIEGTSGFFRGMIERAGVREGTSKEDFTKGFTRMQEQFRSDRERGGGESSRDGSRGSRSSPSYFVPMKKERVTLDLPEEYSNRDVDADGQIGLYEWREWDRGSVDQFFALDRDGDGFLTPKEITAGPAEAVADSGSDRDDRNDADDRGRREERSDDRRDEAPAVSSDEAVATGRRFFALVDGDRDGKATPAELGKLKKLRPAFEKAGIRLDQDMTQDQFVANYVKAVSQ